MTPKNALQLGYVLVQDVIYDEQAPDGAMVDIIELIENNGYVLGQPATNLGVGTMVGLYEPITT
ncbi:MAG: hypothetical protein M3Q81_03065 [bacterium]|nr:hypothetical protein [bacterium]